MRETGRSGPATFFLATIDSVSTTEGVTIIPDGQSEAVPKKYKCLTGAGLLAEGDRVVVMKHSGTCVVLGKLGIPGSSGDDKVSKAGDTMTGNLSIDDSSPGVIATATDRDSAAAAAANGNSVGFRLQDKNGNTVAIYTDRYETTGEHGAFLSGYRMVNGSHIGNALRLLVDAAGNKIVKLSSAAAWRAALGLGNASGALPITVAQGGTGAVSAGGHTVFAGPNGSSAAAPAFRALAADDLPAIPSTKISGPIPVEQGGTGATGVTKTSVASEIFTINSGFKNGTADFTSWGKVAMIRISATASAAITTDIWHTIATLAEGKGSAQALIQNDVNQRRMRISGRTVAVYGPVANDETFTFYATYLLA